MEIAWSMPPDSVPTYFSQLAVNVASSCKNIQAYQTQHSQVRLPQQSIDTDQRLCSKNASLAEGGGWKTVWLGQTFKAAVIARAAQHTRAEELDRPEPALKRQTGCQSMARWQIYLLCSVQTETGQDGHGS